MNYRRLLVACLVLVLVVPIGLVHAQSVATASLITQKTGLNLNQTNTDNAVTVTAPKYIVRRVTMTNCSTSLAASLATVGVFTATGGGGTTIVALGLLTTLDAATRYMDMTIAATSNTLTASTLQIRNGVTHGAAATCDVYIYGDPLP